MTLHVFAEDGLMLWQAAGVVPSELPSVAYTGYRQRQRPGSFARWYLLLHIALRPLSLRLSAYCAQRFNERLTVDEAPLKAALAKVAPGDAVLWLNPTRSVVRLVDGLVDSTTRVSLYFLDPVHRLGLGSDPLRRWATGATLSTYSSEEATRLDMRFLVPYAPRRRQAAPERDLDLVYIGVPSPKRLLWVVLLRLHLALRGRCGHLRLAVRGSALPRWFPGIFSERVAFEDYAALCARSRGVLELHERDAGGVTLRATLCQSVAAVHLCNLATTRETVRVSLLDWRALDRFITCRATARPPALQALELGPWLHRNFGG